MLASLDYKLAFDHVNPEVVTQAMAHMGLPLALTQTINTHWQHQTRWLQYKTSTAQEPLCTSMAIPQGDPLSPLSLQILLLAGAHYVETAAPAAHPREQVIYMDDRSWTSTSADTLAQTMSAWHDFSSICGLKESTDKTQVTFYTQQHLELLQQHPYFTNMTEAIVPTACILGSCTKGEEPRNMHEKETARLQAAKAICSRIKFLPTDHQTKIETARVLAISRASYGWVAFTPPPKELQKIDDEVRQCSGAFLGAARHMHNLLLGGTTVMEVVIGVRQVLLYAKRWMTGSLRVSSVLAQQAMTFLAGTGWSLRNTTWKHAASGMEWHLEKFSFPDYKHKVAHLLREGWRRKQWDALCSGSRRDSVIFRNSTYSEKRVTVVRNVARKSTGPQLAILLGSFYSPAAFSKRRDAPQSMSKCPWCNVEMADQEHIFWTCPSRLTTRGPGDDLERRFGWPTGEDLTNLVQMAQSVDAVWQQRHSTLDAPWTRQVYVGAQQRQ